MKTATHIHVSKRVLHVGCGFPDPKKLHSIFRTGEWAEIRLDINPKVEPDIVGDIRDLNAIEDGSFDAVWSSHNLEHLYAHEVPLALAAFRRVLTPQGYLVITMPDLQAVAQFIADGILEEPIYEAPVGPISPIDMVFGLRKSLAEGNIYMAHKTGFTKKSLLNALTRAGYAYAETGSDTNYNLWGIAYKQAPSSDRPVDIRNLPCG